MSEWFRYTFENSRAWTAAIKRLLTTCSPAAISRLIVSIIVRKPIDGVLWRRSQPHICQKIGEGFTPATANPYASAAVMGPRSGFFVAAAVFHLEPYTILSRAAYRFAISCASMLCETGDSCFSSQTSTAGRIPVFEIDARQNHLLSAVATNLPRYVAPYIFGAFHNEQSPEFTSGYVFEFAHK